LILKNVGLTLLVWKKGRDTGYDKGVRKEKDAVEGKCMKLRARRKEFVGYERC
jgi:hypothetical protein